MNSNNTHREADLITQNLQDLKQDLRELRNEFKKEIQILYTGINQRLESISALLQTHNGRMDDFEKKQVNLKADFEAWVKNEADKETRRKQTLDLKEKRRGWIVTLVAAGIAAAVSIIIALLT